MRVITMTLDEENFEEVMLKHSVEVEFVRDYNALVDFDMRYLAPQNMNLYRYKGRNGQCVYALEYLFGMGDTYGGFAVQFETDVEPSLDILKDILSKEMKRIELEGTQNKIVEY